MGMYPIRRETNNGSGLNPTRTLNTMTTQTTREQPSMIATHQPIRETTKYETPIILVIEDDPDIAYVLKAQLEFYHFVPVWVTDGLAGLKWLAQHKADLIILDVMMPGWDGMRVCKHIRRKYSASELPILMLSALGSSTDNRVRGLAVGANDFLAKPYDLSELIARIRNLLIVKDERVRAEAVLSRYLAHAVRTQARSNPNVLTSRQVRHAVVVFADLRGFTHLSTQTDLFNLTDMLDQFFGGAMSIVNQHNGLVLDLAGDELLTVFNISGDLSDDIWAAVSAAVEMQTFFWDLQSKWAEVGFEVGLGIGIHRGEVMMGNLGGEELMRYTATGNVVNVAHRLVELAQPGEIIVSAGIYHLVQARLEDIRVSGLPAVTLKGIDEPQPIYKLYVACPEKAHAKN